LNYSDSLLDASKKGLEKVENLIYRINDLNKNSNSTNNIVFDFAPFYKGFEEAMDDDFNTSKASAVIFDFVKEANRLLDINSNISNDLVEQLKAFLEKTAQDVLGIIDLNQKVDSQSNKVLEEKLIKLLIDLRIQAKKEKNFALSDKIRDELKELGITLQDSKDGTTYKISEVH
ncbi:MAG: cysteine--tRNA ligase, partial [Ignavibacteriaceae bacterium]|nr:cysteine--tRNA ligase [Ignavibacteriaceae bacterium]